MHMKILILGGFLGSGKTTVLLHLVNMLCSQMPRPSVVILENEISSTDVDSKMLRSRGMTVKNLAAGCICCTSRGLLMDAIEDVFTEFAPDYLITEATGMAYPDAILQTIQEQSDFPASIVSLVDASRWKKLLLAMPDFIRGQLHMADTILLNKADLVDSAILTDILQQLRQFTDCENIYVTTASQSLPENIFSHLLVSKPEEGYSYE